MTLYYYKVMFQLSMFVFNSTTIPGWYLLDFKRKMNSVVFKILSLKWFYNIGIDTGDLKVKNLVLMQLLILNCNSKFKYNSHFDTGLHVVWCDSPIEAFLMLEKIMST